ncbi:MAG: divergent PAP2 family protein [Spirochaetaceae bacterium]
MEALPHVLILALVSQISCQIWKAVAAGIRTRRIALAPLFSFGGFPSGHAAFTASVTVGAGMQAGFDSAVFAVSLVLTTIVLHDAVRVRGGVQRLGTAYNEDRRERGLEPLPLLHGHTVPEIIAGVVVGSLVALIGGLLW